MSYTRDNDAYTRGPGAIAAIDHAKSRRRLILEAKMRRRSSAIDQARVAAARGVLGAIGRGGIETGGGVPTHVPVPRSGGTIPSKPRSPLSFPKPIGTPGLPSGPKTRMPVPGGGPQPRLPKPGGPFGTGTMGGRSRTGFPGFPIGIPTSSVPPAVAQISGQNVLPTASVAGGASGGEQVAGGPAASSSPLSPVDTSANYAPDDTDILDDGSDTSSQTTTTPTMSTAVKVGLAALGVGALWLFLKKG